MIDLSRLPPKTKAHKALEEQGWIQTSTTYTHTYYRKANQAACVPFDSNAKVRYWEIKIWMESNYR